MSFRYTRDATVFYLDPLSNFMVSSFPQAVHLFINDFVPTVDSVVGDFVEATFTGYIPTSLSIGGLVFLNAEGAAEVPFASIGFTNTGASPGNLVHGYWYEALGRVVFAERITPAVDMSILAASLTLTISMTMLSRYL
jgi:hypothetical protein